MTNLTLDQMAQLQQDAASFAGRWEATRDDESDSIVYIGTDSEKHVIASAVEFDGVADPLARLLNAVPSLIDEARGFRALLDELETMCATSPPFFARELRRKIDKAKREEGAQ